MADYVVIFLVGVLGLSGAGWWVILVGAIGLSMGPWLEKWQMLRDRPWVPVDGQILGFFASSFANGVIACSASYLIGMMGRLTLVFIF